MIKTFNFRNSGISFIQGREIDSVINQWLAEAKAEALSTSISSYSTPDYHMGSNRGDNVIVYHLVILTYKIKAQ